MLGIRRVGQVLFCAAVLVAPCVSVDIAEPGATGTTVEHYLDLDAFDRAFEQAKSTSQHHVAVALLGSAQNCLFDNFISRVATLDGFGPVVLAALDSDAHETCEKLKRVLNATWLACVPPRKTSRWFHGRPTEQVHYADDYYRTLTQFKPELLFLALKHGLPVLLTDIDVIYVQSPFAYFEQAGLGKKRLMFTHADDNDYHYIPNTGVCYGVPSAHTIDQAKTWTSAMHNRPEKLISDQETLWALLGMPGVPAYLPGGGYNKPAPAFQVGHGPVGSSIDFTSSKKFRLSCQGCHQGGLVASHCTGQCCKTHEMQACAGWWKPTVLGEDECAYFGVSSFSTDKLKDHGVCPCAGALSGPPRYPS